MNFADGLFKGLFTDNALDITKVAQLVSYVVAIIAAILAVRTYISNSRRERAKWAVQLFEKFYEGKQYKTIRDKLDCDSDNVEVKREVQQESADFTDYLNFFEMVGFLVKTKQLSEDDVLGLFQYYLQCLKKHPSVMEYVNTKQKGFERLSGFLRTLEL